MNVDPLDATLAEHGLFVMGRVKEDQATCVLIGAGPTMWPIFQASQEYKTKVKDPLDTWSKRILQGLARSWDANAVFPSDGPPYLPFIAWAKATDQFWDSPTGMMIHHRAGLMISIRGALQFKRPIPAPDLALNSPCISCDSRACEHACPVGALSPDAAYDVPTCKTHISSSAGASCLGGGCLVRRACPVSQDFGRDPNQSAFHMRAFIGTH